MSQPNLRKIGMTKKKESTTVTENKFDDSSPEIPYFISSIRPEVKLSNSALEATLDMRRNHDDEDSRLASLYVSMYKRDYYMDIQSENDKVKKKILDYIKQEASKMQQQVKKHSKFFQMLLL